MFVLTPLVNDDLKLELQTKQPINIYVVVCYIVDENTEKSMVLYPSFLSRDDAEKYVLHLKDLDKKDNVKSRYYEIYETILSVPNTI